MFGEIGPKLRSGINFTIQQVFGVLPAANHPALTGDVTTPVGSVATTIAAGVVTSAKMAANPTKREITFSLDGQGSAIAANGTWYLSAVPYAGTITSWNMVADVSGSIVIDVWKLNAAVPTVTNTITASALPTLSSAQSAFAGAITAWTTAVAAGDVFAFHVNSAATVTKVSLTIMVTTT